MLCTCRTRFVRSKTRCVLNFKRIPYVESFLSYPDIKGALQSSRFSHEGPFTLPAICAPELGHNGDCCGPTVESFAIALHLDKTFPSDRQVFPSKAAFSLAVAVEGLLSGVRLKAMAVWLRYIPEGLLDKRGGEYFRRTRESQAQFGQPLEQVGTPDDREKDVQALLDTLGPLASAFSAKVGEDAASDSPYLMGGDQPTYADFMVLGFLVWAHRTEMAAGADAEPKGVWFQRVLDVRGGGLGRLWEAGKEWAEGQGEVIPWTA